MTEKFPYYIEDWILWLGRYRDDLGNEVDFPFYKSWPVKLANYDVNFIVRGGDALHNKLGFTDRQVDTAVTIITKYKKQIKLKLDRDVDYIAANRPLRMSIREVDKTCRIKPYADHYEVQFPYLPEMVDNMHKFSNSSSGNYYWKKDKKVWHVSKTERNLALLKDFVEKYHNNSWQLNKEIQKQFDEIDAVRTNIYRYVPYLELDSSQRLIVCNSNEWLDTALADFDFEDDLPNAVFRADNFGLRIGPKLSSYVKEHYPDISTALLMTQQEIFSQSKLLNAGIDIKSLEKFMTTIRADYWIFLGFNRQSQDTYMEHAMTIQVPGEKIFSLRPGYSSDDNIYREIIDLNTKDIVLFVDNSALINRVLKITNLSNKPMLRVMHLQGESPI